MRLLNSSENARADRSAHLQVQFVDRRFQKRDGGDDGPGDAGAMSRHPFRANGGRATRLDPLGHRDEVAGGEQVLALETVVDPLARSDGWGGNGLCAQAAAINCSWQNEWSGVTLARWPPPPRASGG